MSAPLVLTTPAGQQARWRGALEAKGVPCIGLPLIEIEWAPSAEREQAWAAVLKGPRLVIFVSPSAVAALDDVAGADWGAWPPGTLAACVGPGTAQALRERGVGEVICPPSDAERFDSETLWPQVLQRGPWRGADVLVLRGDGGREWLADQLVAQGATVHALSVYRRACPSLQGAWAQTWTRLRAGRSLWFITSAQAVDHVRHLGGFPPAAEVLTTHPKIAAAAEAAGAVVHLTRSDAEAVTHAWKAWSVGGGSIESTDA